MENKELYILRELETLKITLLSKAVRTAVTIEEFIQRSLLQGISADLLESTLIKDLEEGGKMFGEFRKAIKNTVGGNINRVANIGQYLENNKITEFAKTLREPQNEMRWITVQDKDVCGARNESANISITCFPRHNLVKPFNVWMEDFGLPQSGQTVCGERCRCVLVPKDLTTESGEPIQKENNV